MPESLYRHGAVAYVSTAGTADIYIFFIISVSGSLEAPQVI